MLTICHSKSMSFYDFFWYRNEPGAWREYAIDFLGWFVVFVEVVLYVFTR